MKPINAPALKKYMDTTSNPQFMSARLDLSETQDALSQLQILTTLSVHYIVFARFLAVELGDNSLALKLLLLHVLYMTESGHVRIAIDDIAADARSNWLIYENIIAESQAFLSKIDAALDTDFRRIIRDNANIFGNKDEYKPVIITGDKFIYLQKQYDLEKRFLDSLASRIKTTGLAAAMSLQAAEDIVSALELKLGTFQLNKQQRASIITSLTSTLAIVSGGPGTGKTTTIVSIIRALLMAAASPINIILAAPTGRAASRIMESISRSASIQNISLETLSKFPGSASTVHKLLGISKYNDGRPGYNLDNQLPADVLIVDEASMIDLRMMTWLFEALPVHCKLILVGDKDQLPSVDTGALLSDLMEGKDSMLKGSVVQLEGSKRSNEKILELAGAVNAGDGTSFIEIIHASSQELELLQSARSINSTINDNLPFSNINELAVFDNQYDTETLSNTEVIEKINKVMNYFENFAILCPSKIGELGTAGINQFCQKQAGSGADIFYPGQPIMITRNDYELDLYNGDKGIVIKWADGLRAVFRTTTGLTSFSLSQIKQCTTSYAQTIHKSQGSEYERVLIIMSEYSRRLLTREILYTAITRAKNKCYIYGNDELFIQAINKKIVRYSGIIEFVKS